MSRRGLGWALAALCFGGPGFGGLWGCLGSPEPPSCADLPPGSPGCPADAGVDAAVDAGRDAQPDAERDAGPDAAPDAGPDAGLCAPGASEPCGGCGTGRRFCDEDGQWSACIGAGEPGPELCNGVDDDCDDAVDEALARGCGTDLGACAAGTESCVDGAWVCEGAVEPGDEQCDGALDEDCDGAIDEGCPCPTTGASEPCGPDEGACTPGRRTCTEAGWSPCEGAVGPAPEGCDGIDEDCDGAIDEGLERPCGTDVGECAPGVERCVAGEWRDCADAVAPAAEVCNGLDDDCDGATDEDAAVACGTDEGVCTAGSRACVDGALAPCDAPIAPGAQMEGCAADMLDEDCDGAVDEGCPCVAGEQRPCGLSAGRCEQGTQVCGADGWGACADAVEPRIERCDGLDDDCDGSTDEGFGVGQGCVIGVGACFSQGQRVCRQGEAVCDAPILAPTAEVCNGRDDDCDGRSDEDVPPFDSAEVRVGATPAGRTPAIAALDGVFAVARVQAGGVIDLPIQQQVGDRQQLSLAALDARGRALGAAVTFAQGALEITALTMTTFDNQGDAGFVVLWAERRTVAGAEQHSIRALVAFPARDGFGEVDGPLELLVTQAPVTSIAAVADGGGIALAWTTAIRVNHGYIPFEDEPMLAPVVIGGGIGQATGDAAIAVVGRRFVIGYTTSMAVQRTRRLELVTVDGPGGRVSQPVEVESGDRVGEARLIGLGESVLVAWSRTIDGLSAVRLRTYDGDLRARGVAITASDARVAADSPALAVDGQGRVGLVWSDARAGEAETEVYFGRLVSGRDGYTRFGATLAVSDAAGLSGPVALAGTDGDFGVAWYDGRDRSAAVWFRAGPLGCDGAAMIDPPPEGAQ